MTNITTNVSEYEAISALIQHYIVGAKSGKGDDMKVASDDASSFTGADLVADGGLTHV